jgi:transcriptional regulator with XRE-family HTH domain
MPRSPDRAVLTVFGTRVRELRQRAGLSQEELAFRAGLHPTYVSSVERGQRNVSLLNISALADGLAVPLSELLAGVGAKQR